MSQLQAWQAAAFMQLNRCLQSPLNGALLHRSHLGCFIPSRALDLLLA